MIFQEIDNKIIMGILGNKFRGRTFMFHKAIIIMKKKTKRYNNVLNKKRLFPKLIRKIIN